MQLDDELSQINVSMITYLIFEINSCLDACGSGSISIDEVKSHAEKGDILTYLQARFDGHIDLSLIKGSDHKIITAYLQDINHALHNKESRKFGIKKCGLCLLIAWLVELIQRRVKL